MLVVGSHGRSSFRGMLMGSVSLHCVTQAHCPVVVVRQSG
ncbi:MAG: universal stress protein [Streptosporangiaceae bacterium]